MRYLPIIFALLATLSAGATEPETPADPASQLPPVQYQVSFRDADRHLIQVEVLVPTGGQDEVELMMPVWTPGSYLVREYARHVEAIAATSPLTSQPLELVKTAKNRWRVTAAAGESLVRVEYRLYCREMSVRTNWVEHEFACLNGAATFLTPVDMLDREHRVAFLLPGHWRQAVTALPAADNREQTFVASSFDELVDSPIVLGNPKIAHFTVAGVPHRLVTINDDGLWDNDAAAKDVQRIVETQHDFWGSLPYEHYTFLNVVGESGGGLEHDNSTLLMTSRWAFGDPARYRSWLSLVSHELFHAWNVRRLRPRALMRYDYEQENYFDELWIAEGVTSYYDDLLQRRAGLLTKEDYLKRLSGTLSRVMMAPGTTVQSLRESSFDTWIKHYRPDENSGNSRISYYTKGALVAWLLDAKIRQLTEGEKSLDDVMRALYQKHANDGYTLAEFRQQVDEVAGQSLSAFLETAVDTAQPLDFSSVREVWGLRLGSEKETAVAEEQAQDDEEALGTEEALDIKEALEIKEDLDDQEVLAAAATAKGAKVPYVGASVRGEQGRLVITQVVRGSPADLAGWNVDDELLAVDRFRATEALWNDRIKQFTLGTPIPCLISRRGKLVETELVLAPPQKDEWKLSLPKKSSDWQAAQRQDWLKVRIPSEKVE